MRIIESPSRAEVPLDVSILAVDELHHDADEAGQGSRDIEEFTRRFGTGGLELRCR